MNREHYEGRYQEFPEPIRRLSLNDPLVHRIVTMYCSGDIVTMDAAMLLLVEKLHEQKEEVTKRLIQTLERSAIPTIGYQITPQ